MDKNWRRNIVSLILLAVVLILPLDIYGAAGEKAQIKNYTVKREDVEAYRAKDILESGYAAGIDAVGATSEWDAYTTDYYYSQLSTAKKKVWNGLDEICKYWMTGEGQSGTMKKYSNANVTTYMLGYVEFDGMSHNAAVQIAQMFRYANPQYYFLDTYILSYYYSGDTSGAVTLTSFSNFASGSNRSKATTAVKNKLDAWNAEIATAETVLSKEKKAHDLIINNTVYQSGSYDQSVYSVLCQGKSVCAGYAGTFMMLCNKAGIETIPVTSSSHEWNKIKLNGNWYNVDVTFDDPISTVAVLRYTYFNRSQTRLRAGDTAGEHTEETLWNGLLPSCTRDSGATASNPGTIEGLSYDADTTSTSGGTSGSTPENTSGSTSGDTGSTAGDNTPAAAASIKGTNGITVTLDSNGGYIGSASVKTVRITVTQGKAYGSITSPKRSKYQFSGWYTQKSGGSKVTATTVAGTSDITLYARWKKISVSKATVNKVAQAGSKKLKVTVKKVSGAKGYQIRYSLKSSMKSSKSVNTTSRNKVLTKLKKGKNYYIQVRAYKLDSEGKKVYGSWSKTKKTKVNN